MTFDPTQNRTPCGPLMTDEELATLKASATGWLVWGSVTRKWDDIEQPRWSEGVIYRAKPEPVVTSTWQNLNCSWAGYLSGSFETREQADKHASSKRIAILRIDTCNGVSTAHLEPAMRIEDWLDQRR